MLLRFDPRPIPPAQLLAPAAHRPHNPLPPESIQMKVAALLTSHVMEALSHLPGVATQDWADRAASAITKLAHPCTAAVLIGRMDSRGFLDDPEIVGAARSTTPVTLDSSVKLSPAYIPPVVRDENATDELTPLRNAFRGGDWVGWSFGPVTKDLLTIQSAQQLGLLRRGEGSLWKRWAPVGVPTEVLGGACAIPSTKPGRVVLVELGLTSATESEIARQQAALVATLPFLASKIVRALGLEGTSTHDWLTPREELVLWHLLAGKKVPTIAEELRRSVYTVHDHVKSLHRKLGASNRGQLVARALGHLGPLTPSDEPDDFSAQDSSTVPSTAEVNTPPSKPAKKASKPS